MNIKDKLYADLKVAMKEKLDIDKNTIQLIRAKILKEEKDSQRQLNDYDIESIILKEKKDRLESIALFEKANRKELIEKAYKELGVISRYLPKTMSETETTIAVEQIIKDLNANSKMFGQVMSTAKSQFGHKVDGKLLYDVVKKLLE